MSQAQAYFTDRDEHEIPSTQIPLGFPRVGEKQGNRDFEVYSFAMNVSNHSCRQLDEQF
jgi:hypothetical protein